MKAAAIAAVNLRRLFRERSNIFFVIILPMLLIFLIGSVFGGGFTPEVGIYDAADDARSRELVAALDANEELDIVSYDSEDALVDAVSRGRIQAGIVIPAGFTTTAEGGQTAEILYFGRPDSLAPQLRSTVSAAAARQNLILRAALFARQETGVPLEQAAAQAAGIEQQLPAVSVAISTVGEDLEPDEGGGFEASASSQLLLFIYLTSLTGSIALIETRRLGVSRRMLSTPTSALTVLFGETLGRYAIAVLQGLIIMAGSALFFGVGWGDPFAAAFVMLLFALVGAGAGMLLGSLLNSEQQAAAIGLLVGLGSAAIGGSMVPLEIFPETLKKIAHATPHAWGNDAFNTLLQDDGGLADIATELGMLAAFAAAFLLAASWLLHRKIAHG
jgi:ABC-2 type transport system permease protein